MVAKRLAMIVLIHEDHSDYAIAKTLKVSNTTVAKLRKRYDRKAFQSVITGMRKNRNEYLEFVETLLEVIHLGLPRYAGPNRYTLLKR
jgi:transposase